MNQPKDNQPSNKKKLTDEEFRAQLEEAWEMEMNGEVQVLAGSEERVQELLRREEAEKKEKKKD